MNLLITGGCGFVGQRLIQRVSAADQVMCSVRKIRKHDVNIKQELVLDIDSDTDWSKCLTNIDVVIHLAARAHIIDETSENPLELFRKVNAAGTINLARQAVKFGVRRFVFVSSIGVNGPYVNGMPFTEHSQSAPQSDYAISKYEAEEELKKLSQELGLELVIVRPTLVYGAGAPGNFGNLVRVVSKLPFLPFGCTNNSRSFISVDNLADFLYTCASHPKAAGETFLISDGEDVSSKKLTSAIAIGLGKKIFQIPIPVILMSLVARLLGKQKIAEQLFGDLQVNSNKARDLLNWSPPENMSQALLKLRRG